MEVIEISTDQTLAIRHKVLWPDKPVEFCIVAGDEHAKHYGVRLEGKLVSVASLYLDVMQENESGNFTKTARLRKFATLENYQGRGIGSALFKHLLSELQDMNIHSLWFDARESAIKFYEKFGFQTEGKRFYKGHIPYFKMNKILSNKN